MGFDLEKRLAKVGFWVCGATGAGMAVVVWLKYSPPFVLSSFLKITHNIYLFFTVSLSYHYFNTQVR